MTTRDTRPATTRALMPEALAMVGSPARNALREAAAALDRAEHYQQPLEMGLALAQVARCYRALQAFGPAESYLERALIWARTLGAADQAVEILCLLAETACALAERHAHDDPQGRYAALERTRDWAFEASGLARHVADPEWEIKVLLRVSEVLDRCSDHEDAVRLQLRAMRLMYVPHVAPDALCGMVPARG